MCEKITISISKKTRSKKFAFWIFPGLDHLEHEEVFHQVVSADDLDIQAVIAAVGNMPYTKAVIDLDSVEGLKAAVTESVKRTQRIKKIVSKEVI